MNVVAIAFWVLLGWTLCEYTHRAFRWYFSRKWENERKRDHFTQTEEFRESLR